MANIKFFQQNSSLQACSSKTGLRDNATARQNNYRAIRGVNFANSPAQHLFAARQSSLSKLQTSPLFPAAVAGWVTVNNNTLQMHSQERLGKTSQSICQIPLQADFELNPILFGAIVACMGCPGRGESPALTPSPNSHPTKHNDTKSIPARGCISPRSRAEPHQDHPWCFASPGTTWAPCSPSDPPGPGPGGCQGPWHAVPTRQLAAHPEWHAGEAEVTVMRAAGIAAAALSSKRYKLDYSVVKFPARGALPFEWHFHILSSNPHAHKI